MLPYCATLTSRCLTRGSGVSKWLYFVMCPEFERRSLTCRIHFAAALSSSGCILARSDTMPRVSHRGFCAKWRPGNTAVRLQILTPVSIYLRRGLALLLSL
jgi:hypothetical protein